MVNVCPPIQKSAHKKGSSESCIYRPALGEEHRPLEELVKNPIQEEEFDGSQSLRSIYFDYFNLRGLRLWERMWKYKRQE